MRKQELATYRSRLSPMARGRVPVIAVGEEAGG